MNNREKTIQLIRDEINNFETIYFDKSVERFADRLIESGLIVPDVVGTDDVKEAVKYVLRFVDDEEFDLTKPERAAIHTLIDASQSAVPDVVESVSEDHLMKMLEWRGK